MTDDVRQREEGQLSALPGRGQTQERSKHFLLLVEALLVLHKEQLLLTPFKCGSMREPEHGYW